MHRLEQAEPSRDKRKNTSATPKAPSSPDAKTVHAPKKSPTRRRYEQVEPGIYRNTRNGKYFERPYRNGNRTWRALAGKN